MISHLSGTVLHVSDHALIVDVQGVGYQVFATQNLLRSASLNATFSTWTHLAVRETSMELFGFANLAEKEMFEMLLGVSGIGPRSALAILDLAPVATLGQAIARGESEYLTKVSGIGKKTAQKIVIELRDKMDHMVDAESGSLVGNTDAMDALVALGYSIQQARTALQSLPAEITSVDDRIKEALKYLNS